MSDEFDYKPSTQQVVRLLRARFVDSSGNHLNDASDETVPNATETQQAIDDAYDEVREAIGTVSDGKVARAVTRATALLASANIEMSYFPEQATASNSTYSLLYARYESLLERLEADVADDTEAASTSPIEEEFGMFGEFPVARQWDWRPW